MRKSPEFQHIDHDAIALRSARQLPVEIIKNPDAFEARLRIERDS